MFQCFQGFVCRQVNWWREFCGGGATEGLRLAVEADDFLRALGVTASFGVVTFPHHGLTAGEIRRLADSGLCLARHHNGNCVKVASLSPISFGGD